MTPREFLTLLWQYKPEEHYVLVWTLQDKQSHWFQDVAKAAEFVERTSGRDVYVGLGSSKEDLGPSRRCKSEEVAGMGGLGADFDFKSEAHGTKPLPTNVEEALSIIPPTLPPTIVVFTGNGIHAWWMLKEPFVFDSDDERKDAARLLARFHAMLAARAAARGWVYDKLSDLARILRIPGTKNMKDPARPKEVAVLTRQDRFYNLSDIEEFLEEFGVQDPEAESAAAQKWQERFNDTPIVVNLTARIPDEMLAAWMDPANSDVQMAMRFRNTWQRQRHDLKDPSQSGYDLALADFGVDAGLPPQLIVDLIVHHRALHGKRARTRVDYYQRTIARAEDRADVKRASISLAAQPGPTPAAAPAPAQDATASTPAPQAPPVAPDAPEASQPATPKQPDPDAARAAACKRLSEALGIRVLRLVKITGKEPQYRMELASGQKIEFPSVQKLLAYDSVKNAIAGAIDTIIPKIKGKRWDELSQLMLRACVIEEGTEEMDWVGATRMHLEHYLSETGFIPSIESQMIQHQRRPMVIDGCVTVCASDFQTYVNKTTFQNLSIVKIAGMLSALGARSIRVRGGGKFKDQSRWALPLDEFDPKGYPSPEEQGTPEEVPF